MADPLARNDWIGTREDRWTDILPQSWQSAINTNPMVNALQRYMQPRQSFDQAAREWQDNIPGNSPIDRIAEGRSTVAKEYPSPMNPLAADMLEKGGFLANFLAPGAPKLPTPAAPKPQGIRAYHGSPHDFDRFDISKIGTGEGAQAYGRGLYFAEAEGVAKQYRDNLSQARPEYFDGAKRIEDYGLTRALQTYGPDLDTTIARIKSEIAKGHPIDVEQLTPVLAEAQRLKASGTYRTERVGDPGRMYEVRINADPERFLDWDKPLSQQPEAVRKVIEPALRTAAADLGAGASPEKIAQFEKMGLKNIADRLRPKDIDPWSIDVGTLAKEYPNALRDAGIPGIRYKDAMSRDGAGPGTSNYVVFDDKMIEILRKYGLLPPVAAGAAQAVTQGQDTVF